MNLTRLPFIATHTRTTRTSICASTLSKPEKSNNETAPDDPAALARIKEDLDTAIPLLKKKLSHGKEHLFSGPAPFRMIQTVAHAESANGLAFSYFRTPEELEGAITSLQPNLSEGRETLITGAFRMTPEGHHAAVVGLIKRNESALLVLDSSYDPLQSKRFSRRVSAATKGTTTSVGKSYDVYLSDKLKNIKNNSIYFTYLATQASISDCATFSLLIIRNIITEPNEIFSYYSLLNQRASHIASENPAKLIPGMQRIIERKNNDGIARNKTFVLSGDQLLPPMHYIHTQSKRRLQKYCDTSRFVDQSTAKNLMEYHEQNRQRVYPAFSISSRIIPRKANLSIRNVQINALEEARSFIEKAIKECDPGEQVGTPD